MSHAAETEKSEPPVPGAQLSPARKLGFALLAMLLSLLAVEICAQIGFRLWAGVSPYAFGMAEFEPNHLIINDYPYLPYFVRPGQNGKMRINSWGQRSPEPENPKRRVRVLCLGGSTTFAADLAEADTWPNLLADLLGPDRVEVLNAGECGFTSADNLINFALLQGELQPDFVLVYHGTNDLEPSYARGFRPDYSHRRRHVGEWPYLFERMPRGLDHCALYVLLRHAWVGYRGGDLWQRYTRTEARYDFSAGPKGLAVFQRNLRQLGALVKLRGGRTVLGTFQICDANARGKFGPEFAPAWRRGIDLQNEQIRELARTDSLGLAEVTAELPPEPEFFSDFCHLNRRGNERIARAFAAAVRQAWAANEPAPPGR